MKKMILAIFAFTVYSYLVFASGTMQLEGSVVSISKEKIEINDGYNIYLLLRNRLVSNNQTNLNSLKVGQNISLMLPFDAVESTKELTQKK